MNVFNRQRRLQVDRRQLLRFLERVSDRLDLQAGFSVALVSDRAMRRYHRTFAGRDYATDVLSFPAGSSEREDPYLGDILISVERADAQRADALAAELNRLALHGVLHLMGYDHEADRGEMRAFESQLCRELGL